MTSYKHQLSPQWLKIYILQSDDDSEPVTKTKQTRNEDCLYIKLLIPTEMMSPGIVDPCTILSMAMVSDTEHTKFFQFILSY